MDFKEKTEPAIGHKIIKPLQFSVEVTRSLSSWYKAVPAVDVQADLQMLEVGRASSMYVLLAWFRLYITREGMNQVCSCLCGACFVG